MYEQLGLAQDDIFHKTKLLLSIYRDVVWATLADCNCVNEEIYYYGDDLTDALVYLEEFAPDVERSEFERRVCNLFENKWMIDLIDKAMSKVYDYYNNGRLYHEILSKSYLTAFRYTESELLEILNLERSKRTETSKLKTAIESGKRRIQDLDKLIERIYEDQVLGNISAERYARMSVNYENEQRTLINKVAEDEKKLACIEQTSLDLKTLLKVLRSSTSFEELTPTLVNSLIRRFEVHNNDKSSGHCYVKVDIYFTAIGLIDIPTEDEIKSLMAKIKANPQEYRLTA